MVDLASKYRDVLCLYRKKMPKISNPESREWLLKAYPHLDRGRMWNRALYDFNVRSDRSLYTTGICLSLAIYGREVTEQEGKIICFYSEGLFCHAVLEFENKHYDAFYPEGIDDISKMMYVDVCEKRPMPDSLMKNFFRSPGSQLLKEEIYKHVEEQ